MYSSYLRNNTMFVFDKHMLFSNSFHCKTMGKRPSFLSNFVFVKFTMICLAENGSVLEKILEISANSAAVLKFFV